MAGRVQAMESNHPSTASAPYNCPLCHAPAYAKPVRCEVCGGQLGLGDLKVFANDAGVDRERLSALVSEALHNAPESDAAASEHVLFWRRLTLAYLNLQEYENALDALQPVKRRRPADQEIHRLEVGLEQMLSIPAPSLELSTNDDEDTVELEVPIRHSAPDRNVATRNTAPPQPTTAPAAAPRSAPAEAAGSEPASAVARPPSSAADAAPSARPRQPGPAQQPSAPSMPPPTPRPPTAPARESLTPPQPSARAVDRNMPPTSNVRQFPTPEGQAKRLPRVLVVDDSPTVRKLVSMTLQRSGYEVVHAADGMEALSKVHNERPDLILLDVTMPHLDGLKVCRVVKSVDSTQSIPIIFLSGKDGFLDKVRGRTAGAADYLAKPLDPVLLLRVLQKHLKRGPRR